MKDMSPDDVVILGNEPCSLHFGQPCVVTMQLILSMIWLITVFEELKYWQGTGTALEMTLYGGISHLLNAAFRFVLSLANCVCGFDHNVHDTNTRFGIYRCIGLKKNHSQLFLS